MVDCKKVIWVGLLAGLVMALVSWVVLMPLFNMIFPDLMAEYESSVFRPWDDPLMSYVFVHPFIMGMILAYVFQEFKPYPKKKFIGRGLHYGFMFWLLVTVPGMLMSLSSFAISTDMVVSWSLDALIDFMIAGVIIAKLSK